MKGGWQTKKLEDVCEIERGGSPRPIQQFLTSDSDGVNWIKIGDATASGKYIYKTEEKIKPAGVKRSRMVRPDDFILSNSMSFGRPYIMKTTGCIHDGWLVLRQRERQIDQDFLYYMLSSDELFRQFDRLASGSTVRNLNIGLVKRVEVSFPHLSEQKRIVSVLEEALSGLATAQAHAEENIQNLRELFASHLQLVFTQRDKGWKERRLGELCDILDNQRKPITKRDRVAGAVPYYGATGIQDHVKNFIFDEPLILVGEDGAKWASGERTAFSISGKSWVNNHAHVLRPHRRVVHDHWLTSFLTHSDLTPFVSGLTVPKLNQGSLREIPIPLPPLHVQEKLGRDIRALEEEIQRLGSLYRQKVFASKELKKSLLYSAFSGAL